MEITLHIVRERDMKLRGHLATFIPSKQRTGQSNNTVTQRVTFSLPDKINKHWYEQFEDKLTKISFLKLRHEIYVKDNTDFLQAGYQRMIELQPEHNNYLRLILKPSRLDFPTTVGIAILALKKQAKGNNLGQ